MVVSLWSPVSLWWRNGVCLPALAVTAAISGGQTVSQQQLRSQNAFFSLLTAEGAQISGSGADNCHVPGVWGCKSFPELLISS